MKHKPSNQTRIIFFGTSMFAVPIFEALGKSDIPVIGIAKRPDRLVVGVSDMPTIRPKMNNYGFNMIQHMRDEAHRFAKKYHTHLRNKNTFQTP
jgi:excinuclease ABC subunit C